GAASATGGGSSFLGDDPAKPAGTTRPPGRSSLSADGRFTVFTSPAANLIAGQIDPNNADDVFLFDHAANTTTLVSRAAGSAATAANAASFSPVISADGRYVTYESQATALVPGYTGGGGNPRTDVFLFDRVSGQTTLVSHTAGASAAGGDLGSYG